MFIYELMLACLNHLIQRNVSEERALLDPIEHPIQSVRSSFRSNSGGYNLSLPPSASSSSAQALPGDSTELGFIYLAVREAVALS